MNKEIEIPKGYEARIEGNKVIFEPKESEDERICKAIHNSIDIECLSKWGYTEEDLLSYFERQKGQKPVEWSKEDKEIMDSLIEYHYDQGEISQKHNKWASWLKSLRPQPHWKPSEEQINALKVVARGFPEDDPDAIDSLLSDLQKLL